ncbi:uncharacterized protein LAESUDRAFT_167347 [Laetiporus sulphureus 93-53]|uniref:Uncharacterized protein n=1 Tax=Laetiporus sulphureus 93-53 TaxID=1314785 RepID=A0A165HSI7_9APHY|nr:uncharacterized protein LAESUDRAFT_167347 [Laetiporus sulphureus 93-53]KZT12127.1 hypothetical protein LAESUDRAFT_167347 [Laetiporus sulphureus 93-53]
MSAPIPFLHRSSSRTLVDRPPARIKAEAVYQSRDTSPHTPQASLPIAIPRRKTVCPPPSSPLRLQPSPELVFNFDFSVSPCSFQGHGQMITRMDEWAQNAPFLHQRGRTNILLAHQCHQQQKAVLEGVRRFERTPGEMTFLHTDAQNVDLIEDNEKTTIVECVDVKPAPSSGASSIRSSVGFAMPPSDTPATGSSHRTHRSTYSSPALLTAAFQQSLASSVQTPSPPASPPRELSPIVFHTPSPVSPPSSRGHRRVLSAIFPRNDANPQLLRTAAAPVVSFKVAQAERSASGSGTGTCAAAFPRGRSPYPGIAPRPRRRSSAGSCRAPTVVGTGRGLAGHGRAPGSRSSLILSTEEIERSLDYHDVQVVERENIKPVPVDIPKEGDPERCRERGRARGRGIMGLRGVPVRW